MTCIAEGRKGLDEEGEVFLAVIESVSRYHHWQYPRTRSACNDMAHFTAGSNDKDAPQPNPNVGGVVPTLVPTSGGCRHSTA